MGRGGGKTGDRESPAAGAGHWPAVPPDRRGQRSLRRPCHPAPWGIHRVPPNAKRQALRPCHGTKAPAFVVPPMFSGPLTALKPPVTGRVPWTSPPPLPGRLSSAPCRRILSAVGIPLCPAVCRYSCPLNAVKTLLACGKELRLARRQNITSKTRRCQAGKGALPGLTTLRQSKSPRARPMISISAVATLVAKGTLYWSHKRVI